MDEKEFYVFISYSRSDRAFVNRLMADLEAAGVKVWIDKEGLKPGMPNFDQALRDALRSAYALLLVASPHSRRSNYVQGELEIAEMYNCPVYPVWSSGDEWADCVPLHMIKMQYVDARGDSYPTGLADILATLNSVAPGNAPPVAAEPVPTVEADFEPRNPYKGLRAFREDDQADFFGRQKLVEGLLETLRNQPDTARLLAIVGPSGSGKSSIIMAGLLPRLRAGRLAGSQNWVYLDPIVPGTHPLRNLSVTLANALPERSHRAINEDLTDPEGLGLHLLAGQITRQPDKKLVIFIDQFEELFTQTVSDDERKQFINLLVSAVTEPRGSVIVMLTLRADFYDRPMASAPALAGLLNAHHPILPMTIDDMRAVIEEPARLPDVKVTFDEGLVGDLLFETRDQAGGLPLLQFTLDQLFQRREGHRLTLLAYQAIGGLRGALAKHAESTYAALPSDAHRQLLRALFLRLIEPGATEQDTTRRRAPMSELQGVDAARTEKMQTAAATFVEARLLTADKETIEVSHEALIREWPRLGEWLHEGREDIRLQKEISGDAAEWSRRGQPTDRLYQGSVLEDARNWTQRNVPSQTEMAFIEASAAYVEQLQATEKARLIREETQARELELRGQAARRLRIFLSVVAAMLLIALGLGAFALTESSRASAEADAASTARFNAELLATDADRARATSDSNAAYSESLRLAAAASDALIARSDPQLAALLGIRALRAGYSWEADAVLGRALSYEFPVHILSGHTNGVYAVSFSPDGRYLLSGGADATARLWDIQTSKEVWRFDLENIYSGVVNDVAFSPDGRYAAIGVWDATARLLDVITGQEIRRFVGNTTVDVVAFSPDGRYLVTGSRDSTIRLWNVQTGEELRRFTHTRLDQIFSTYEIYAADFSSDGQQLLTGGNDGIAHLWNVATGQLIRNFVQADSQTARDINTFPSWIGGVDFHPNGQYILTAGGDSAVYLWDVNTGDQIRKYMDPFSISKGVRGVQFAPDGNTFATAGFDAVTRIWDTNIGIMLHQFSSSGSGTTVWQAAFNPDGHLLASASGDGLINIWETQPEPDIHRFKGHIGVVADVKYAPSGDYLLTQGQVDSSLRLWDARTGTETHHIQPEGGIQTNAIFSSDSRYAFFGDVNKQIVQINLQTGLPDRTIPLALDEGDAPSQIALAPDGEIMAVGTMAGNIWLANLATGENHWLASIPKGPNFAVVVNSLIFSSDGGYLLVGSNTFGASLWDVNSGSLIRQFGDSTRYITSLALSPDGRYAATGETVPDTITQLWDVNTGESIRQFTGHSGPIYDMAFSPDGTYLLTGSNDLTARLWKVDSGTEVRRFGSSRYAVLGVAFSPDGQQVAIDGGYGANYEYVPFWVWSIDYRDMLDYACQHVHRDLTAAERKLSSIADEDVTCAEQVENEPIETQTFPSITIPQYTPLASLTITPSFTPTPTSSPTPTVDVTRMTLTPTVTAGALELTATKIVGDATQTMASIMTATAGGATLPPLIFVTPLPFDTVSPFTPLPTVTLEAVSQPTVPPDVGPTWTPYPSATVPERTPLPTPTPSPTVDLTRTTPSPTATINFELPG